MEPFDEIIKTISLTMGAAWASGINLYATIFVLGWLGVTDNIALPPGLEILMDPMVLAAAGLMYFVEFFADIAGVWTALQLKRTQNKRIPFERGFWLFENTGRTFHQAIRR